MILHLYKVPGVGYAMGDGKYFRTGSPYPDRAREDTSPMIHQFIATSLYERSSSNRKLLLLCAR